ncbi:flavodoxin [Puteibacter caeruleilacunae]|nr:flavodoxin [Puteibacter caeruleilacunae]
MSKVAVFFGSSTGNTEAAAKQIAAKLEGDVFDVADDPADKLGEYDNLILGTSTWGVGDLQDDWEGFISDLESADLSEKVVAIFGFGDSMSYGDSFVDGVGTIYEAVKEKAKKVVGFTSVDGYEYDCSTAEVDGQFVGLILDEENQSDLSDERIDAWVSQIQPELN